MSFSGLKALWPFQKGKIPLVTILMPCKDPHPGFFKEAVRSVTNQTSKDWYLIIINDHSSSREVLAILKELRSRRDPKVRVIDSGSHFVTGALNTGMKNATTPYVCALHCDDLLAPAAVSILNTHIHRFSQIDYFHSSRRHINEKGNFIGDIKKSREKFNTEDFRSGGIVKHLHCWKVRSALEIGGMDESLGPHGADDYDFPWRMAEAGYQFQAIPDCLYYYRDHREHYRLTTHVPLDQQKQELTKIFQKHGLSPADIQAELDRRSAGYLQQALYSSEGDKQVKKDSDFDPRSGWRELC